MRPLSVAEAATLGELARIGPPEDIEDETVLDLLTKRGCVVVYFEDVPGEPECQYTVWSINDLGRLALRVATMIPPVTP